MANNYFTPLIYDLTKDFTAVFAYSYVAIGLSALSAATFIVLDSKYRHIYLEDGNKKEESEDDAKKGKCAKLIKEVKKISPAFWCIMLAQISTSNVYYQFMNFGTNYTMVRFNNVYDVAAKYMSLIPFAVMIFMVVLSIYTQVYGQKGKMIFTSGILS